MVDGWAVSECPHRGTCRKVSSVNGGLAARPCGLHPGELTCRMLLMPWLIVMSRSSHCRAMCRRSCSDRAATTVAEVTWSRVPARGAERVPNTDVGGDDDGGGVFTLGLYVMISITPVAYGSGCHLDWLTGCTR